MTPEQAIEIYAHACRAWYKIHAAERAEEMVRRCSRVDDLEGVWWWERVKFAIISAERPPPPVLACRLGGDC